MEEALYARGRIQDHMALRQRYWRSGVGLTFCVRRVLTRVGGHRPGAQRPCALRPPQLEPATP